MKEKTPTIDGFFEYARLNKEQQRAVLAGFGENPRPDLVALTALSNGYIGTNQFSKWLEEHGYLRPWLKLSNFAPDPLEVKIEADRLLASCLYPADMPTVGDYARTAWNSAKDGTLAVLAHAKGALNYLIEKYKRKQ